MNFAIAGEARTEATVRCKSQAVAQVAEAAADGTDDADLAAVTECVV